MTDQILTQYFQCALHRLQIYPLEHGAYFGYIPALPGLYVEGTSEPTVRQMMQERLSAWLASMLYLGLPIPPLDGIDVALEDLFIGISDDS